MTSSTLTSSDTRKTRRQEKRAQRKLAAAQGRAAARLGWRFVRTRPNLVLWRFLGLGLGEVLPTVLGLIILGAIVAQVSIALPTSDVITSTIQMLTSPTFLLGFMGCVASITALGWWANAVSEAGVWEACAEELDPKLKDNSKGLWARSTRHIAHLMGWHLFYRVCALAATLLMLGVHVGTLKLLGFDLPFIAWYGISMTIMIGVAIWAELCIGVMAWYPATALTQPELGFGERLLHCAMRVAEQIRALYHLFFHVVLPLIPIFIVSWLCSAGQWLTLNDPNLNSLISSVGVMVDLLGFIAVVAAAVAWRAGSTFLEASWCGQIEPPQAIVARQEARAALGKSAARSTFAHLGEPHPEQPEILDVSWSHLRPTQHPHVFALSKVLSDEDQAPEHAREASDHQPSNSEHA